MLIEKKNKVIPIILILFLLTVTTSFVTAKELEIINTNYNVIESKSGQIKQYYNIFVTIENTESLPQYNITVEIVDEWDIPTRLEYDFQPQEKKTITFDNYPLAGGTNHQITVNYHPTNTSLKTPSNSGTLTFNVTYDASISSETPFLNPMVFLLTVIGVSIIFRKKKMKLKK